MITVEVAFAPTPQNQLLMTLQLVAGSSVIDAVMATGWQQQFPQLLTYDVGIFSQKATWQSLVKTGDRIELYRPLRIDPQNKRKLLSQQTKQRRKHER